jgi:hypothetical protein
MAINLNPGADAAIVTSATRAGMSGGPGDYSKQFESIAQSYAETMESNVKMWKSIMDTTVSLASTSVKKAGERRRANIDIRNTPGFEGVETQVGDFKSELKKTWELKKEGTYEEYKREVLDDYDADPREEADKIQDWESPISEEEWKKTRKNNPLSRENRDRRSDIYKQRDAFYAEVAKTGAGLKVINDLQASGEFDAKATGAHGIELAEAFAASQTTGEHTKNGNYFESSYDPKKKRITHTLMNDGTGGGGIPKGAVKDEDGEVRTYTTEQIQGVLVPKDPNLEGNYTEIFNNAEKNGKLLGMEWGEYQSNKAKKSIEPLVETSEGLHRSIHATFGHLDKSFHEEFTSISELSAKEYAMLASVLPQDEQGNLLPEGVLRGVDGMSDNKPGIQQSDFANPGNQNRISLAMFDKGDKFYSEQNLKDTFIEWVAGEDGKLARANNVGMSRNTNVMRMQGETAQAAKEAAALALLNQQTGLPKSIAESFPSGTNYGNVDSGDGNTVSITGDTFRNVYQRLESGIIKSKSGAWKFNTEKGYWQSDKGKILSGTEMLKALQPPKGPSLLTSTGFQKFKSDKKGGLPFQWSIPKQ